MEPGLLLKESRQARGLDQAQLAARSGTSQTYISRVERGEVSPALKTLTRLFNAMGQQLALATEPLDRGNVTDADLRESMRELTAAERVREAMDLSEFLTGVAESAARKRQGAR